MTPDKLICLELEGPLSPQDNLHELMSLFPRGERLLRVIQRYGELLALEGREGYEPGDTLALVVPFLMLHRLSEEDIQKVEKKAPLTEGAADLVSHLKGEGWHVACLSAAYEYFARPIAERAGIASDMVLATRFSMVRYRRFWEYVDRPGLKRLADAEKDLLSLPLDNDHLLKERLDGFYRDELPDMMLTAFVRGVKPLGGQRKAMAVETLGFEHDIPLERIVMVGSNYTDARALGKVHKKGGLAIAFNGDESCLSNANVGLASARIDELMPLLAVWGKEGLEGIEQKVKEWEVGRTKADGYFHWLEAGSQDQNLIRLHQEFKRATLKNIARSHL